jgi:heparan-alpha-glucosaminide N-acetyltransferase
MADAPTTKAPIGRLASLDAYRGFVMLLMAGEMLKLPQLATAFPDSDFWQFLKHHGTHVSWTGRSLHDLIQPSFSFMVALGQSKATLILHALWRGLMLVLLGVFLRSLDRPMTYWTFEDTLSQIGLGYPLLFMLGFASARTRWLALGFILVSYWGFFAFWTITPEQLEHAAAAIPKNWTHDFEGFSAHWNINRNPAWAFDTWFLNLFPREKPFIGNPGGYSTLSFIPTLGTMLLGLIAGTWLRESAKAEDLDAKAKATTRLVITGLICLALGRLLHVAGICPIVKKIWTPAWVLFSGGWCFLLMAGFYWLMDVAGKKRWAFPLMVVGMNSIAMYVLVHTIEDFTGQALLRHFGESPFLIFGKLYSPTLHGAAVLLILWLILLWMHRRKLYVKV